MVMRVCKGIELVSGIGGVFLPVLLILSLSIALPQAPWFNWIGNAISDLGRPEYSLSFFNWTLTVIGGLLLFFSIGLILSLQQRIGPTLLAISSIYFIGVGIYPLPSPIHVETSSLFFIAFPLGFFFIGYRLRERKSVFFKKMSVFAFAIPLLAVVSPSVLVFGEGIAIPELLILIPGFLWCAVYGLYLLRMLPGHQRIICKN